jgi:hypothetical protein
MDLVNGSGSVGDPFSSRHARAVSAAVKRAVRLDAVPDHLDAAVLADRGERMNRTLETVEGVRAPVGHAHLESLIVLISAHFTLGHLHSPFPNRVISHFYSNYPDPDQDKRHVYSRCRSMSGMKPIRL